MSLEILMVRHGKTEGNQQGRYIGTTDESLCAEGITELEMKSWSIPEVVYASPMKRCLETAQILWPGVPVVEVPDFRECDFGEFENKNYKELSGNPAYQAWIDSSGTLPFPKGESVEAFKQRVQHAFQKTVEAAMKAGFQKIALAVHGGTIMAVMEKWGSPQGEYYRWQVKNGEGFIVRTEGKNFKHIRTYG